MVDPQRIRENLEEERNIKIQEQKNKFDDKQHKAEDLAEQQRLEKVKKAHDHNLVAQSRTKENLSQERIEQAQRQKNELMEKQQKAQELAE